MESCPDCGGELYLRNDDADIKAIDTRIARGGSWKTNQDINLSYELDQNTKTSNIGFRLVRDFE